MLGSVDKSVVESVAAPFRCLRAVQPSVKLLGPRGRHSGSGSAVMLVMLISVEKHDAIRHGAAITHGSRPVTSVDIMTCLVDSDPAVQT